MNIFSKQSFNQCLVVSLQTQSCRLQLFSLNNGQLSHKLADQFEYTDLQSLKDEFVNSTKKLSLKNAKCHWVLGRDLYETYHVSKPNVSNKELDEALKWQVKELVDQPISQILVSHYQHVQIDNQDDQVIAVTSSKELVETLIDCSQQSGVTLESIDIEELVIGHILKSYLDDNKIIGFIGEDDTGLIFNFYRQGGLSFTRHKKGQFMPQAADIGLTLQADAEAKQELFLLEVQRTLDYVVSQVFRRPIDTILLQRNSQKDQSLANLLTQITELKVTIVSPQTQQGQTSELVPNLVELGAALKEGEIT